MPRLPTFFANEFVFYYTCGREGSRTPVQTDYFIHTVHSCKCSDDQKITPNEFRELSQKIDEDQRKQMAELNKEYEKHDRELRDKYPNSWYYANYQFDRF